MPLAKGILTGTAVRTALRYENLRNVLQSQARSLLYLFTPDYLGLIWMRIWSR